MALGTIRCLMTMPRKGAGPTIVRAMALNCGALASYDQIKEMVGQYTGDSTGKKAIVAASFASGGQRASPVPAANALSHHAPCRDMRCCVQPAL